MAIIVGMSNFGGRRSLVRIGRMAIANIKEAIELYLEML